MNLTYYTINLLAGVQLYGGPRACGLLSIPQASCFHNEYSSLACTVEIVDDVFATIDHIHKHGRHVKAILLLSHSSLLEFSVFQV